MGGADSTLAFSTCPDEEAAIMQPDPEFSERFFANPAISFTTQPDLKKLFETLADPNERFTIVFGAGVSLDAGLPSWPKLIDNIVGQIREEKWQRQAQLDREDLTRKAEYVLRLAEQSTASSPSDVILRSLYLKSSGNSEFNRNPQPGRLADAIARLCFSLKDRVDIVTTNFDVLLEIKLNAYLTVDHTKVNSVDFFTETDEKTWAEGRGVLHLHGILAPGTSPISKVVLTENEFLEYGPKVRSFILERMQRTNVLFIGVSMTDPNLIGPLWEAAKKQKDGAGIEKKLCFMLSVAAPNQESSANAATVAEANKLALESREFAILRTSYLRNRFDLNTIFFKSYGEQIQALYDASLAIALVKQGGYVSDDPTTSSRYEFRLKRALDESYENVGCPGVGETPTGKQAEVLSDRLYAHLDNGALSLNPPMK